MAMTRTFSFGPFESTVSIVPRAALYNQLPDSVFYIADTNTSRYLPSGVTSVVLESGEASKSWDELDSILAAMLEAELSRQSVVVAVGGGVVCDIASLAANLYMRGCPVVLVPSTVLAMVDAAVGGKTSVNFAGYKNMVGTFYPAGEVRICTELLYTLTEREYVSGLAEVIKTALLGDEELLSMLENDRQAILRRDQSILDEIIWRCVQVKGRIVEEDLTEVGDRVFLNLGHTFAHALESVEGLGSWSHGEAVAWGVARAMAVGVSIGETDRDYAQRVLALLSQYGYCLDSPSSDPGRLIEAMKRDKKRRGGAIRFVLQRTAGETFVTEIDEEQIRAALTADLTGVLSGA